ncbi:MAG: hypothetical protein LBI05_04500 [Planctomycetaceae bacterium]|jgi:hypothetical protein|nr:hypothetical protein [Planctomycetaceae bacterium]
MQDDRLDNLLRDWANDQLPDDITRERILCDVFAIHHNPLPEGEGTTRKPIRRIVAAALAGIAVIAATILLITLPTKPVIDVPVAHSDDISKVRISLIVLKKLPDSDIAVEFLEDTVFDAEEKTVHELELGEHRLFLWVYPLEESLFSLDIGIDKAAETGIAAVLDRPQALQFTSNGDRFDVFVSVLPRS